MLALRAVRRRRRRGLRAAVLRVDERARARPARAVAWPGLGSTAMMVGNVIGPLLGGWLAVHVGLAATFWVPGALVAAVGLALLGARRPWSA